MLTRADSVLRAGDLTERIAIVTTTETPDGQGGTSSPPSTLMTIRAAYLTLSGSEQLQAAAIAATVAHRFVARYRTDITPLMTVTWTPSWSTGERTLQIQAAMPWPSNPRTGLLLECTERT